MPLRSWYSRQSGQNMWYHFSKKMKFHLCVLMHHCLHGTAPPYFAEMLQLTSNMSTCRYLRSAAMPNLIIPSDNIRRSSILCGCWTCLEHSSIFAKNCSITDVIQSPPQNKTVLPDLFFPSPLSSCTSNRHVFCISLIFTAQCTLVHMRGLGIACRPSVRLSVTLVICDHIGWKSWKLIARTISSTPSLIVAKRWSTYSQGNMGKFGGD